MTHYEYESIPGSGSQMGWAGIGRGQVSASTQSTPSVLYFKEQGEFTHAQSGQTLETQNEFVWEQISATCIRLSHSRFGRDRRVELFDLLYHSEADEWISKEAHVCGDDLYSGKAAWNNDTICFEWSISGPRKQENLYYKYTR